MQITRIDSKGRISIPSSVRSYMGIEKGDSFIVTTGKKDIKLMPVSNNGNVEVEMEFSSINALANAISMLAKNNIKIFASSGSGNRWRAILEVNEGIDATRKISSIRGVKRVKTRAL